MQHETFVGVYVYCESWCFNAGAMRINLSIAAIAFAALSIRADTMPDLQQAPALVPEHLSRSVMSGPQGRRIGSAKEWDLQRMRLMNQWQSFLGEFPISKPPLKARTNSTEVLDGFTRLLVKYKVEEGVYTDGFLLVPKRATGKLAAVVVFHPTTPLGPKGVAGVDASYDTDKRQGVQLVKRGFIVWCPRNYINTEGADWAGNARRVKSAHPKWTGMTRMVWDAIRAADYVESLPQVDPKRIGCIGHSLGAKVVLFAMAFDTRYKAGVFSEGGIGLKFSNWDASWYLGSRIREKGFQLENDQLLALIAPRAFLLLAGGLADGDRSWAFIDAVRPVYEMLGASKNIGWWNHHRGHAYPPEARTIAEAFLEEHLQ
jgi:hypothetical protein